MNLLQLLFTCIAIPGVAWAEPQPVDSVAEAARLYHSGQLESAARVIKGALTEKRVNDRDARLLEARIFAARRYVAAALKMLESLTVEGNDYRPWFEMGVLHIRVGDVELGREYLKRSLKLNPHHGASYLWLAKTSGEAEERTAYLGKVLLMESRGSPAAKEALALLERLEAAETHNKRPPGNTGQ